MAYCPRCGVETDPTVKSCPLCSTPLPEFADGAPGEASWPDVHQRDPLQDPGRSYASADDLRLRVFGVFEGLLGVAALVVAVTDAMTSASISWSRYPLAALGAVALWTACLWLAGRRPLAWGASLAVVVSGFLAATDYADDETLSWSSTLGVPISLVSFTVLALSGLLLGRLRRRGWNLIASVPLVVAVELGAIDGLIAHGTTGEWTWSWSLVTALVLVPLGLVFLILHFALRQTPDLRRIFHF